MTVMRGIAAIALMLAASASPALAGEAEAPSWRLLWQVAAAAEDERLSEAEAAERARAEHGGKVLSVNLVRGEGGEAHYRVKLLQDGSVRVVRVPAAR